MQTKTVLSAATVCLFLGACGGGGGVSTTNTTGTGNTAGASGSSAASSGNTGNTGSTAGSGNSNGSGTASPRTQFLFAASNGNNGYELWGTEGTAATTTMVKDINDAGNSNIHDFIRVGDLTYFVANRGFKGGSRLWVSDGTTDGTIELPVTNIGERAVFKDQLFFAGVGVNEATGQELWKTDGTVAGTVRVKDIHLNGSSSIEDFAVFDGALYFSAEDDLNGQELWKTDGTDAGTVMAANIATGDQSSSPINLIVANGKLFFAADSQQGNGVELWAFDGSSAALVRDINLGADDSNPLDEAVVMGQELFFTAFKASSGLELWRTDGARANTVLVSDIAPDAASSEPRELTVIGNEIFFSATNASNGRELWKASCCSASLVKNINQNEAIEFVGTKQTSSAETVQNGNANKGRADLSSSPFGLFSLGGKLYFSANGGDDTELWVSDGTEAGTVLVKDLNSSSSSAPTHLGLMQYFNQDVLEIENIGVLLAAFTAGKGLELWKTDGTTEGTTMVKDINPDAGDGILADD